MIKPPYEGSYRHCIGFRLRAFQVSRTMAHMASQVAHAAAALARCFEANILTPPAASTMDTEHLEVRRRLGGKAKVVTTSPRLKEGGTSSAQVLSKVGPRLKNSTPQNMKAKLQAIADAGSLALRAFAAF